MKKIISHILFLTGTAVVILLMQGCAKSLISVETKIDPDAYSMFGRTVNRNFYTPVVLSDSIKFKWQAETNGSSPPTSVIISDDYVFLSDLSGRVYCFNINTGKTAGQLRSKGSVFAAPIITDLWVVYVYSKIDDNQSGIVIYNFDTGSLVDQAEDIKGKVMSEIIKTRDGVMFITDTGRLYLYNYNAKPLLEYNAKAYTHSSPALADSIFIFGTDKGELIGYNINSREPEFRKKISMDLLSGISVSGNTAFVGDYDGVVYAFDVNSKEIKWSFNTGNRISMIPAYDDDNVYIGNLHGELYVLNKEIGAQVWKCSTGGVLNTTPCITENLLVVPDFNEKVHFVDKKNGLITKSKVYEGRVRLTPVFYKNLLFVGYGSGILEAYEVL